ncbi:MIP/aquaporin family protein [Escherichia coli]|uniref:MIP/aquaporin family protein n=1 Tax=Escherichia coli TaxID=562 RepID=UPI0020186099|nr:aquaporin [Escherichia coli]
MERFTGGIEAYDSTVSVTSQNAVFDRVGSFVNSSLTLGKGAKLTAQSGIFSTGAVDVKENASLTLTGMPSAQKQGYYSPVISTTEGNLFFDFEQTHHIVRGSVESVDLAGTFSTYPNPHINFVQAFAVEMVITAILMGLILALTDDGNGVPRGPLAPLLIGLLIAVIGASMGPLTGFAMNPARDFGPKVFAWLAGWGNVAFTGGRDIPYFLVPLFGPIVGAIVGAFAYRKLIGRHLPCDICVVEEKETTTPSEQKASL